MKKFILLIILCVSASFIIAQTPTSEKTYKGKKAKKMMNKMGINSDSFLNSIVDIACKCSDTINVINRSTEEIAKDISKCVDGQVLSYMVLKSTMDTSSKEITVNVNPESSEYKAAYFDIEQSLMNNCESARYNLTINNKESEKSLSKHELAMAYYDKAIAFDQKGNLEKAKELYELSLSEDPDFAFAWDNLGLIYRKMGNYDKAIESYLKSLEVDPSGKTPAQNLAVVFEYKEEYDKAIEFYSKLGENNPERYYGVGRNYAMKGDFEQSLDNMCKAYILYDKAKSPYRTDAQNIINALREEMSKNGQKKKFEEILKKNNITTL